MSLAALLLALAGATWPSQGPLVCYTEIAGPSPPLSATVQMNVDQAHRLRGVDLAVGDGRFAAFWPIDPARPSRRRAMSNFMLWVHLPARTAMPVMVTLAGDRGPVWSGSFAAADGDMGGHRRDSAGPVMRFSVGPYILAGGGEGPVQDIWGLRWLGVRASNAAGATVVDQRIEFPDWQAVARRLPAAVRHSERQRRRHLCNPPPIP